ncbi:L-lactate permease [Psittacicella gerlachiana]|uniref:L-lactate permease n=1 Tax=Psittacicella gerlachiana TaxID=2028574 RepID=UPI001CA65D6B|nr:lactate permease LctP family transporter [Psittacicella gerlachiana]
MGQDQVNIWTQDYAAIGGSEILTALVALVPIVFFLLALTVLKLKGHIAALFTLVIAAVIATFLYGMPFQATASATLLGILSGLWPIAWIVIWAIFIYNICVRSGKFEVIRSFISGISDDQRVQVLLIAFAFGAFLEGVAGFGIPIAIGAALLIGCGFKNPIMAAALCLVANMASAPTGAIGIPVTVAAQVTHIDASVLSALISRQLSIVIFILPFWLVAMVDGIRGIKDTLPMILVVSIVSMVTAYIVYNYIGHELSDIIIGVAAMIAVIVFSRIWKPRRKLTAEGYVQDSQATTNNTEVKTYSAAQTIFAWSPFIVITVLALVWTLPGVKSALSFLTSTFEMPALHGAIQKGARLAAENQAPESAIWRFDVLTSVGTALFFAAVYTLIAFRVKLTTAISVLVATIKQLLFPILTICFVLAFAKVADYSGQTGSIAILLSQTGVVFPVLAPLLGMLGVFLTGSVVNSNTLFAKVQVTTAQLIHVDPNLLAASNTLGAITGKVISPQSIAIGCAAAGAQGREGELLSYVLKHAVIFAIFICILTVLQAYVLTWTTIV